MSVDKEEEDSKQFGACLKLLQGTSDEEKFAGLLMLTKHVPREEFERNIRVVFDALTGTEFLCRLLSTGLSKEHDQSNQDLYIKLGTSITDSFARNSHCAAVMAKLIKPLSKIAAAKNLDIESRLKAISALQRVLTQANQNKQEEARIHSELNIISLKDIYENANDFELEVLETYIEEEAGVLSEETLSELAENFHLRRDRTGYISGRLLRKYFDAADTVKLQRQFYICSEQDYKKVPASMSRGIFSILSSAHTAPESHRFVAFKLAIALCKATGPGWAFIAFRQFEDYHEKTEKNIQLFARLIVVEISVKLAKLRYSLIEASETNLEEQTLLDDTEMLSACLELLHHFISFLTRGYHRPSVTLCDTIQWDSFSFDVLMQLRAILIEAMQHLVEFLGLCVNKKNHKQFFIVIIQACVRLLIHWIHEEVDESITTRDRARELILVLFREYPRELIPEIWVWLPSLSEYTQTANSKILNACFHDVLDMVELFSKRGDEIANCLVYDRAINVSIFLLQIKDLGAASYSKGEYAKALEMLDRVLDNQNEKGVVLAACFISLLSLGEKTEKLKRHGLRVVEYMVGLLRDKDSLRATSADPLYDEILKPYIKRLL